jgi:hypothetical protein
MPVSDGPGERHHHGMRNTYLLAWCRQNRCDGGLVGPARRRKANAGRLRNHTRGDHGHCKHTPNNPAHGNPIPRNYNDVNKGS